MDDQQIYISIYRDNHLKYPLSELEYEKINDVWKFINEFNFLTYNLHEYRSHIINIIKKNYSIDEFYNLEIIAEKLFWNLRDRAYHIFLENDNIRNKNELLNLKEGSYEESLDSMYNDHSYRSFINKLILIDNINNKYYYKRIEGSAPIFNKNKFNLYTSVVFFNRSLYEKIMDNNIEGIKDIAIPNYYYEYDYPFPNLNFGKPFIHTKKYRIDKIRKMYYDQNAEKNWFKLLHPE